MSKTVLVKYTIPSMYRAGEFRIIAGNNQVPFEVWEKAKKHPGVQKRMEKGLIVVLHHPAGDYDVPKTDTNEKVADPKAGKPEPNKKETEEFCGISKLNTTEANKVIKETFNLDTLLKWSEEETRKSVLSAIEKQIESLKVKDEDIRKKDKKE